MAAVYAGRRAAACGPHGGRYVAPAECKTEQQVTGSNLMAHGMFDLQPHHVRHGWPRVRAAEMLLRWRAAPSVRPSAPMDDDDGSGQAPRNTSLLVRSTEQWCSRASRSSTRICLCTRNALQCNSTLQP
jgi:hypothetical protein